MFALSVVIITLGGIVLGYFIVRHRKKMMLYNALYNVAMKIDVSGSTQESKRQMTMNLAQCWMSADKLDMKTLFNMIPTCLNTPVGAIYQSMKKWCFNE